MHALATEEVKLLDRCDDCGAIVCLRCRRLNTASGAAACNACLYFKEWEEAQHGEAQYQAFLARMWCPQRKASNVSHFMPMQGLAPRDRTAMVLVPCSGGAAAAAAAAAAAVWTCRGKDIE
jgi:hypothetical protein